MCIADRFYASLRASEVANLDDSDIDLINKTIRNRGGKNDKTQSYTSMISALTH
jgi:integrase